MLALRCFVRVRRTRCDVVEDPDAEDEPEENKDEKPNTVIKKTQPPSVATAGTGAGGADAKSTVNTFIGRPQVKVERADAEKANIALKLPCGGEPRLPSDCRHFIRVVCLALAVAFRV